MIKEGKERVIATLEESIAGHFRVWCKYRNYSKSELINLALYTFFKLNGDTFDRDVVSLFEPDVDNL